MDFSSITNAAEDRTVWKGIAVKAQWYPNDIARLWIDSAKLYSSSDYFLRPLLLIVLFGYDVFEEIYRYFAFFLIPLTL